MEDMKPLAAKLTALEVQRALYVDYEGNTDRPPTLLGWRFDGATYARIVEPRFGTCARRYRVKDVDAGDHADLVRALIEQSASEDRRIVSWSEHDWSHMLRVLSDSEQAFLQVHYRNAIPTARAWHRRTRGHTPPDGARLAYFMHLVGYPVAEKYGQGVVGDALRLLRNQLESGRTYPELTPAARKGWVSVVKHNAADLEGVQAVLQHILGVPAQGNGVGHA